MKNLQNITSKELWFLFGLHTPAIIIGFPDPTSGYLADEIVKIRRQARTNLVKRQLIEQDNNKEWIIIDPIAKWIKAIASPMHTVFLVRNDAGTAEFSRSYNFTSNSIVALYHQGADQYAIGPVENHKEIHEFLLEPLITTVYCDRSEQPIVVSEKILTRAKSQIEAGQKAKAKSTLRDSFPTGDQLDRFIQALSNPITRLSLIAFLRRDRPGSNDTKGFSVIAGDQDIWLLRPTNNELNYVQVSSISKMDLEHLIPTFLPQLEKSS